ncbi:MAG TPA: protease pro-enzyme activation domain-containing protein, partial [Candidatus Edwardsbacteria bacterium]|nr:protease pro-enzyme activation domain-containing protein [Candidatus Edwardsbacteria bacterium]
MSFLPSWAAALAVLVLCVPPAAAAAPADRPLAGIVSRARIGAPIDDNARVALTGNRHPDAIPRYDVGPAGDGVRLERMILSLKADADQTAALEAHLAATRDPASPAYRQWITPQEFESHFGAAPKDIDAISGWLTAHGFAIDELPAGGRAIVFSGTVAQVREAFHTQMHRYRVNGRNHLANSSDPQIPRALAAVVGGIVSLHDFFSQPQHVRQALGAEYTSGSTHYLAPADFSTIYDLQPLAARSINGSGRSIAVVGRSNVVLSDIQQFRSAFGLPANLPQVIVNGTDPGLVSGDEGESDLDVEWSGAVAPAATVLLVTSKSTGSTDGVTLSAQYAVSHNVADVISVSYGLCEATMGASAVTYYSSLWQQAASQGMTVVVSSGDAGAAGCDTPSSSSATRGRGVNGLCTSPYSTCVGGTEFADTANPSLYWSSANGTGQGSALSYIPEVVWNESGANGGSGLWASGGGASIDFAKPSWQSAPGVPADGKRDVPDVSLNAATHDGYLVYSSDNSTETRTLYIYGGTSAAAPSFAGIVALTNQQTGYRQGNAAPRLYALASHQAGGGPSYFHNITSGNNSVPGVTGFAASSSTPYYNRATGLGSVDANVLVSHWTDLLPATTTSLTASPNPGSSGQTVTFTATVSGTSPTGTVQFADNGSNLGAAVTLASGVASLSTAALAAGSHSITATYSGDPNNLASTS